MKSVFGNEVVVDGALRNGPLRRISQRNRYCEGSMLPKGMRDDSHVNVG